MCFLLFSKRHFLFLLLCLNSCGYRWNPEFPATGKRLAIEVPYVKGDGDGSLTAEIIRSLAISGAADVRQWGADYKLDVAILRAEGQTIGYRRDRQQISGESQKNLVAAEKRKTMTLKAALYEKHPNRLVWGPYTIEAYVDFDYVDGDSIQDLVFIDPHGISQVVLPFSLGQLESSEAAEEAAMRPLNVQIAKKIVDALLLGPI
jgi:hypothetical protein